MGVLFVESSKEFVGIAEGIKSRELSLSSSLERLRSTLSSLRSERVQLEHQIMSLQAEIAAAENEDEPDEGLIAALELQLEQAYTDLGNTEQEIVETESEVDPNGIESHEPAQLWAVRTDSKRRRQG